MTPEDYKLWVIGFMLAGAIIIGGVIWLASLFHDDDDLPPGAF